MKELPISLIVLEYIKVVLSWPVIVGVLAVLSMCRFKDVLGVLIGRVTGMQLPGGVKLEIPRPELEKIDNRKNTDIKSNVNKEEVTSTEKLGDKLVEIDKDLNDFYLSVLNTNMLVIKNLIVSIWEKSPFSLFKKERPKKLIDMLKALGGQIDLNAIKEMENIKATTDEFNVSRKIDRKKFLNNIQASELLIDYFRRVLTSK
jgi:hypothetical protein